MIGPGVTKRDRIFLSRYAFQDFSDLTARRIESDALHVIMRVDLIIVCEAAHETSNGILQTGAASHDDAQRDCTVRMQALEVFKIPIEKRIFVIPFDFERYRSGGERFDVIDLVDCASFSTPSMIRCTMKLCLRQS